MPTREELEAKIVQEFGMLIQEIRQDEGTYWHAYERLKELAGIKDYWFTEEEFRRRFELIQSILKEGGVHA